VQDQRVVLYFEDLTIAFCVLEQTHNIVIGITHTYITCIISGGMLQNNGNSFIVNKNSDF